jgi:hypothetical protein
MKVPSMTHEQLIRTSGRLAAAIIGQRAEPYKPEGAAVLFASCYEALKAGVEQGEDDDAPTGGYERHRWSSDEK